MREKDQQPDTPDYWWSVEYNKYRSKLYSVFLSEVEVTTSTRILEPGGGSTLFTAPLFPSKKCPKIMVPDIDRRLIKKVKGRYPHLNYVCCDAESLPISEFFDIIFAGEIIEHLREPKKAIKNWSKLSKPGGFLLITTPNKDICKLGARLLSEKPDPTHISLLGWKEIISFLREEKLKIRNFHGVYFPIPKRLVYDIGFVSEELRKITIGILMKMIKKFPFIAYEFFIIAQKSKNPDC